jgi:peroxiredoxin family protein
MPMPVPMPVLLGSMPGMQSMATTMMKQKIKKHGVASLEDLRTMCLEADIKMIACQMTIDLFEFKQSEFIDGIELGGAATFLEFAGEADVTLFI